MQVLILLLGFTAIAFIFWLLGQVTRRNVTIGETSDLWQGKIYHCPICSQTMHQGYVLTGKGIIWTPRSGKPIGTLAHIGQSLENTLSLSVPPALNMAWQCGDCKHILIDYSKLVKPRKTRHR